jgi:hypothetical protein
VPPHVQVKMEFGASEGNRLEWAFDQPNINWTSTFDVPEKYYYIGLDPTRLNTPFIKHLWHGNITHLGWDRPVVTFGAWHGELCAECLGSGHRRFHVLPRIAS